MVHRAAASAVILCAVGLGGCDVEELEGDADAEELQCTHYPNVAPKHCYWTGWMSEEGGGALGFGPGYYARGAQCDRSYCDNKRYYVCQR